MEHPRLELIAHVAINTGRNARDWDVGHGVGVGWRGGAQGRSVDHFGLLFPFQLHIN